MRTGEQQDAQVQAPGAVLDVPEVELDALVPGQLGAPVDLRPARDPGLDRQAPALALGVAVDLDGDRRARADDRHLSAQHVDEVGHLVERRAAQQAPDAGDARVALADRQPGAHVLGAGDHRAQLEHVERAAVLAHAPLAVDRLPRDSRRMATIAASSRGDAASSAEPATTTSKTRRAISACPRAGPSPPACRGAGSPTARRPSRPW